MTIGCRSKSSSGKTLEFEAKESAKKKPLIEGAFSKRLSIVLLPD
jgi:hypothetical protein